MSNNNIINLEDHKIYITAVIAGNNVDVRMGGTANDLMNVTAGVLQAMYAQLLSMGISREDIHKAMHRAVAMAEIRAVYGEEDKHE